MLGLIALGDGWHNNHHHSPRTARHGFRWWQFDPSYYLILALERLGLVWDVKKTPRRRRDPRGPADVRGGDKIAPAGVGRPG